LLDEEVQRAEVAERRGDVKELYTYNIAKKLTKTGFGRYKLVRNNKDDIVAT
jgi:hypothetical protein